MKITALLYKRILPLAAALFLVFCVLFFSGLLSQKMTQDQQKIMEESIGKYAVQCYALEGSYPETIQYLEKHYTLSLNRDKYVYHYQFIGSNMMPEISVFEKGE